MFGLLIPLGTFCLVWMFVVSLMAESLVKLGAGRSLDVIGHHKSRFFYQSFNKLLFKQPSFDSYLFASLLSTAISMLALGGVVIFAVFLDETRSPLSIVLTCVIAVLIALLFGLLIPHLFAKKGAEKSLLRSMPLASCFLVASLPLSWVFLKLSDFAFKRIEKEEDHDPTDQMKETILHILQGANVKGELAAADIKLIDSVVKFKDRIVREVMVPRIDLFSLSIDTTIRKATIDFLEEGYSRIPVYQDSVDNIVGVLMFKDFLRLFMEAFDKKRDPTFLNQPVETIMKTVLYTPETKKVSQLLQEFRNKQTHLAIVVDEYGGTEGVVTMEDLLEEIVGEIADEYDVDEETLYRTADVGGGWIVDARMTLLDAEEAFHIKIPSEGDYDTIGGYIFHQVGSIPQKGLIIHHDDFTLEILSTTDRNVEKVKITPRSNT